MKKIWRLGGGERGQAAIMVIGSLVVLLAFVGLGIDIGRLLVARAEITRAVDAASLAGVLKLPDDPDLSLGIVQAEVQDYIDLHEPDATLDEVSGNATERQVSVKASKPVNFFFLPLIGIDSVNASSEEAVAGFGILDVVLVMDDTSSMSGSPIQDARDAATAMVDLLVPGTTSPNILIGFVPYRGEVDQTELTPLTEDKSVILSGISQLDAEGGSGTAIPPGIEWGQEVLSPEFPYTEGRPITLASKIMVLLTDGQNNSDTNGVFGGDCDGDGDPERSADDACLDDLTLVEAQLAKDAGTEIYVIGLGDVNQSLLIDASSSSPESIAEGTPDHFFYTPTSSELEAIFLDIARQIGFKLLR